MDTAFEKKYFSEGIDSIGNLFPEPQSNIQKYTGVQNAWASVSRAFARTGDALRFTISNSLEDYNVGR